MDPANSSSIDLAAYANLPSVLGAIELIVMVAILGGLLVLLAPALTRR